jgi:anti-sigma regulatory factor (Ser/Thr protein kinase)
VVHDEGPGFDVGAVLGVDQTAAVAGTGGRGLVLMQSFMDEVTYNDQGNRVTLVKRNKSQSPLGIGRFV